MASQLNLAWVESLLTTETLGRRLVYYSSTTSTMDAARREAGEGTPEGTVVLANEQTAGRGRLGRGWVSPPGANLYLTVVLRPAAALAPRLTILTPLAVCLATEELLGLEPAIKWPNDCMLGGKKFAGVLLESAYDEGALRHLLVGAGINVNFDPRQLPEIAETATSLRIAAGHPVEREPLLAASLNHIERLYTEERAGRSAMPLWKARLETLGRQVRVSSGAEVLEGRAEDVDGDGALLLRLADGSITRVMAGDVTLRT